MSEKDEIDPGNENTQNTEEADKKSLETTCEATVARSTPVPDTQIENQPSTAQIKPTAVVAPSTKEDYDSSATVSILNVKLFETYL